MKKVLTFLLLLLLFCSSLFAARELTILSSSVGWNNIYSQGEFGLYTQYQYGISVSEKTSVGISSIITVDFSPFGNLEYDTSVNVAFGASVITNQSQTTLLSISLGPSITTFPLDETPSISLSCVGATASISLTYIPLEEQKSITSLGFNIGLVSTLGYELINSKPYYSTKAYLGFTLSRPFGLYYSDLYYDTILDTIQYL